jgi:Rieske Fe-S protein
MSEDRRDDDPPPPRWREDFPIHWEHDHYVTRRELAKFLTLGSGLLAGAAVTVAVAGPRLRRPEGAGPRVPLGPASAIPPGGSMLFRYPSDEAPCILVRRPDGTLRAYSQVCTHLSCALVQAPDAGGLYCPCHHGHFSAEDGRPTAGPPTRRLQRVLLEQEGDTLFAVGTEI